MRRTLKFYYSAFLFILAISSVIFTSCKQDRQVVIGFVADLSSRNAELGISGRNGLEMAIDEINGSGGLNGYPVLIAIGDHNGDKDRCFSVVSDLIEQSVDVIIGPMVSGLATTVIEAAKQNGTLIIAPTVSSDELSGIDDMFLRVASSASNQGSFLAKAIMKRQERRIAIVMDGRNRIFTKGVLEGILNEVSRDSSFIIDELYFSDKDDYRETADQLEKLQSEAIVFVASGIDTAGIIQQYAKNNQVPQLYGSQWVKVTNVTEYGGKTVEGMIIVDSFENKEPLEREIKFTEQYTDRFGTTPNIASRSAYESVQMYADAVRKTKSVNGKKIKEYIVKTEKIEGILDDFQLDEYGDGLRELSYFIVENNDYSLLEIDQK